MSALAQFQFLQPGWLLLLPPLWLLIALYAWRAGRRSMWERTCDARLLDEMTQGQGQRRRSLASAGLFGFILSLGVVALAAPSWSRVTQPLMEAGSARVIALDLSRSMLVQDVRPSRYLHAQAAAAGIVDDDFGGETGLVVYAGSAFVLSPLSRDSESLLAFIEAVDPSTMPLDGVNLGAAIDTSVDLLEASFSGRGQVLLVTAGDTSDSGAVQAASRAAASGHRVSVLAVGSRAGGPLLDEQGGLARDSSGRIEISRANLSLLHSVVAAGNGQLARASGAKYRDDLLSSRVNADELVESAHTAERDEREASNDGAWLVWWMLLPTLWLFRRNQLWLLLVFILPVMPRDGLAADTSAFWRHREAIAYDAYRRGDFDRVRRLSQHPLVLGASYYRSGQFTQALEQFSLVTSPDALYNRANALVQLQRYPEALAAYREALALDPVMTDARYNLRLLENFIDHQGTASSDTGDQSPGNEAVDANEDQDSANARIGSAAELEANPADNPENNSGSGASLQSGQVDPTDRFSGEEADLERFILRAQDVGQPPPLDSIERWISSLPDTSQELYRRKFLRDLQRQQQQER